MLPQSSPSTAARSEALSITSHVVSILNDFHIPHQLITGMELQHYFLAAVATGIAVAPHV
uniref:Uncharacterized protein n=1 Tax=Arundo donax TaxID=35708 RepID=A0A0A9CNN4_ARUDO